MAEAKEHKERFKVSVADPKFSGNIAGVTFKKGVGYTDNPHQQLTCSQVGAIVDDREPPKDEDAE